MEYSIINDLPASPKNKLGYPWTHDTPPQYFDHDLPKISIITPSFNQGNYIEETIRSVLLQGYPNLEYIIIDGGSTDNTIEIIKKYEKWITYWVSEPDEGQSHAINKGLKLATGEIFNWLNSDDYYLPNALLTVGQFFKEHKNTNVLCGYEHHLLLNGQFDKKNKWATPIYGTIEQMLVHNLIVQPPTFFRLSIVRELGNLNENLYFCMDAELWIRYLTQFGKQRIYSTETVFNVFRYHNDSKSVNQNAIHFADRYNLLMCLLESCSKNDFPHIEHPNSNILNRYFFKKYNFRIKIDEPKLQALAAAQIILFFKKHINWSSFWQIYFYTLRKKTLGHSWLFYLSPLLKTRQHLLHNWK